MTIRVLHTADWQLGKPFASIAGDTGAALRQARFDTVRRLAEIANEREVSAVLVAGDAFDNRFPTDRTLYAAIDAMRGFSGPWVLLPGNHDPADGTDLWQRLSRIAGGIDLRLVLEPIPQTLADGAISLLPAPLRQRHGFDDPTQWMDEAPTPSSTCRIGLAHGSIREFGSSSATPNLIAPDRATRAKLDYLALGDWHGFTRISECCWYSGTPEADGFAANEPGFALLVELDGPGLAPKIERIATGIFKWRQLVITDPLDVADIVDRVELVITKASRPDRLLLALQVEGVIDLAGRVELAAKLAQWQDRIAYVRIDDRLRDQPSEEDLSALARGSGVVAATARQLIDRRHEPAAALALRHLFDLATASEA